NCKVIIRVRPPLPREIDDGKFISTIQVSPESKKICIYEYYNIELVESEKLQEFLNNPNNYTMHQFSFDHVYDQDSTQQDVYDNTARQSVISALQGFNATIMAYGQTGTGKTFTMEGFKYNSMDPQRGIIPRSIEEIFKYIETCSNESTTFMVRASYLQIYNEIISDLIHSERNNLNIREDKKKGVFVDGLSEWAVRNPTEIFSLIQKGAQSRRTASTKMNDISSRSHAVFIITIEQMTQDSEEVKQIKVGKLNIVDLAGSERVRVTGATGKRLEECKKINQSLSCLGNVISALTDYKYQKGHIPYRDSKLTRLLEDSLGGNCKTTMMAMISPAQEAFNESLSSLKFANRAKNIKNQPIINEDLDQRALLRKYEIELKQLKRELEERNKLIYDKSRVIQLEEDKKKAEQDKKNAIQALEKRSKEFFLEREEKKSQKKKQEALIHKYLLEDIRLKILLNLGVHWKNNKNLLDSNMKKDYKIQKKKGKQLLKINFKLIVISNFC
ncbi:kinesin motor domain protein, partial [Ichthyophthirius multifiliis]